MFWTPAFAGVTGREKVIILGNGYNMVFTISESFAINISGFGVSMSISIIFER